MQLNSAKDLEVYKKGYVLAMNVFEVSRSFPAEERYSLTDQLRRSARSVCANLREAWAKRRYKAHFLSKLTDADAENGETDTWLDFAYDSGYLSRVEHQKLAMECRQIGAMLGKMINAPDPFLIKPTSDLRPPTSDLRPRLSA